VCDQLIFTNKIYEVCQLILILMRYTRLILSHMLAYIREDSDNSLKPIMKNVTLVDIKYIIK